MASAVLIVASTRAYVEPQEILRIQDIVSVLLREGKSVDVLIPRRTPLLSAALNPSSRVFTVPRIPFTQSPSRGPSCRRFLVAALMFFHGVALAARREYAVIHGINDGALVARAIDRATIRRHPYIAEISSPFANREILRGPATFFAQSLERSALRHASAIVMPTEETLAQFDDRIPRARTSLIPDPSTSFAPGDFTLGDFHSAVKHVYDYVLRPRSEK